MFPRLQRRWLYALMALILSFGLHGGVTLEAAAEVFRSFSVDTLQAYQLANLSAADEMVLGAAIDQQLKQDGLILYQGSAAITDYVRQVGERVFQADSPPPYYQIQVIDSEDINAFATVGGFVYIYTGLLKLINTEAELAGVLAHEAGHVLERHGLNQLWHLLTVQQSNPTANRMRQQLITLGSQVRTLSNSYEDEYEADRLAFYLLGRAGYAQTALVTLLQRLQDADPDRNSPNLISTHPNLESRLAQLRSLLATEREAAATDGLATESYQSVMQPL